MHRSNDEPNDATVRTSGADNASIATDPLVKPPSPHNWWPQSPQPLQRRGLGAALVLAWDVALTLLPLLFLAFAGAAALLHQQPLSARGEQLRRAAQLGPSVFPFLFAVIVRRMLRMVARSSSWPAAARSSAPSRRSCCCARAAPWARCSSRCGRCRPSAARRRCGCWTCARRPARARARCGM